MLGLALFLIGGMHAHAQSAPRPQVIVIVCSGLSFSDLHLNDDSNPNLANLAETGTVGLMNCSVNGEKSDIAAKLTLAIGQQQPAEKTDARAGNDWEILLGQNSGVGTLYRQLTGLKSNTSDSVKHLGIQSLQRRGLAQNRLGASLSSATPAVKTWIVGNSDRSQQVQINGKLQTETIQERSSTLLAVDALGVGGGMTALHSYDNSRPFGLTDNPSSLMDFAFGKHSDLTIVELGDVARAEIARPQLSETAYREAHDHGVRLLNQLISLIRKHLDAARTKVDILIVSPRPPSANSKSPQNWNRLTPFIAWGPDFPPGRFLSDTTRTPGVISNSDFAPTILSLYQVDIPPSMIGKPLQIEKDEDFINPSFRSKFANRLAALNRLDFLSNLNDSALVPALFCMGVATVAFIVAGLLGMRFNQKLLSQLCSIGLIFILNAPCAFMLSTLQFPPTVSEYLFRACGISLLLTLICTGGSSFIRISPALLCCGLNLIFIIIDLLSGQTLLKESLLSNYLIGGFRYYGIGNEYLGVVLAFALGGGLLLLSETENEHRKTDLRDTSASAFATQPYLSSAIALAWMIVSFVLSWSAFGANSGSLVVTIATFGVGIALLSGKRAGWATGILCALLGLAMSFLFAWLDLRSSGSHVSHAGAALGVASRGGGGPAYLLEIALRKLSLNLRLLVAPWTLFTLLLLGIALFSIKMLAGDRLKSLLLQNQWIARGGSCVGAAVVSALIFKDTGVVTVCYFIGFLTALLVCKLLGDNSVRNETPPGEDLAGAGSAAEE